MGNGRGARAAGVAVGLVGLCAAVGCEDDIENRIVAVSDGCGGEDSRLGSTVGGAGDTNGDGYDDVVVGAAVEWPADAGRVCVYLGGPDGTETMPGWVGRAPDGVEGWGDRIATPGDVNGDGFADLAVGDASRISLFLGSADGLGSTPAWTLDHEQSHWPGVVALGDVNGDGLADLGLAAELPPRAWYGTADGLPADADWRGPSEAANLVAAGDIDGDGYDDVLLAEPGDGIEFQGRVELWLGSPDGLGDAPAWIRRGIDPWELAGDVISAAGDVDGDGYDDFVFSTGSGEIVHQRLHLWRGGPDGPGDAPVDSVDVDLALDFVGPLVAPLGDADGDGHDDLVVREWERTTLVLFGAASGFGRRWSTDLPGDDFPEVAAAGAGDVDGDGLDDLVLGDPMFDLYDGRAALIRGPLTGEAVELR